jgi:1-acyl-sn-glycerol-3-phosphate acyltransferase
VNPDPGRVVLYPRPKHRSLPRMRATLRSLWAWPATITLILLWLPLLAIIRRFDRDPALYTTGRWFRRLGAAITRVNPAWKIHVSGVFPEDPRHPYIVVCNHQSLGDIPVVSRLPWEMKWVAKVELFRVPYFGRMMRLAGDIPLDRTDPRSGVKALMQARQYLQQRCSVIFFPEGTRSPDGRVYAFTDGAFRMAIKEQVPVLPLALDGTRDALPKHSWRFGLAESIRVTVLPPVETAGLTAADTARLRDDVRQRIVQQVAAWRGVPPEEVDALTDADVSARAPSGV